MVTQTINAANLMADHARAAFANDYNLTKFYHSQLNGKWNQ
jgi:hypothetical protein